MLVMGGALCRTMLPLRWLAAGSNLGLLIFGALHPSLITFLCALVLLPLNLYRAVEITLLTRRVKRTGAAADMASMWLRPHMKQQRLRAGQTLFNKGDRADRLYLLVAGRLVLTEIGLPIEPGRIFGEIALFSQEHSRTQTAQAETACRLLVIHESTVRQLFVQNPAFAFHLVELLAERLGRDLARKAVEPAPAGLN
jgi:CRP-like cAMP-binding protein